MRLKGHQSSKHALDAWKASFSFPFTCYGHFGSGVIYSEVNNQFVLEKSLVLKYVGIFIFYFFLTSTSKYTSDLLFRVHTAHYVTD